MNDANVGRILLADQTFRVFCRRIRDASHRVRAAQPAENPPLQNAAGGGSRAIGLFAARAAHREHIVAGDQDRRAVAARDVNGIGMIQYVNQCRTVGQFFPEPKRKQDVLIDVSEPFRDEAAGQLKFS